jgi:single-strand DNA-binding protein
MAASYNRVVLVGTLVRDPEIRYIPSGAGVTKFRIAVNPNKRDPKPEDTLFVDIIAWEKLAETCNTYLKKGMSCLVEGRLSIRQYDDKEGNKRQATEIVINAMQMLGSPRDRQQQQESSEGFGNGTPVAAAAAPLGDSLDEEIPF